MGWISLTTASSDLGLVGLGSYTLFWSLRVVLLPKTSLLARSKPSKLISRVFESSQLVSLLPSSTSLPHSNQTNPMMDNDSVST
jgi:hypothetical protein